MLATREGGKMTPRILRTNAAAEYVGLAAGTLEKMRTLGTGPRFLKLGRAVGYDIRDLDAWLDPKQACFETT